MVETAFYVMIGMALTVFASVRLSRIAPGLKYFADNKPLGCNVCISFWYTAFVAVMFYKWTESIVITVLAAAPAVGISIILLDLVDYIVPRGPVPLPENNGGHQDDYQQDNKPYTD